jgi:hypothetical protein
VVLIDAGSTLTDGDVRTILALQEAAIPVHVLLSKADILDRSDCEKTIGYVKQHINEETGLDLPVHPVSVRPSHHNLLDWWFGEEILPLYSRSQELRAASLQRKIGALKESVVFRLRSRVRQGREPSSCTPEEAGAADARLRRVSGLAEETRSACEKKADAMAKNIPALCSAAAAGVMKTSSMDTGNGTGTEEVIRIAVLREVQGRMADVRDQVETLARQLQDELVKSAGDLGISDKPTDGEFLSLVREMPVFDPGTIRMSSLKSSFSALLGKRFEEDQLARQIHRQIGGPLEQALASYTRVLKEWIRRVTAQIGRQFDTYAERYRAQTEQAPQGVGLTKEERQAIEDDLKELEKSKAGSIGGDTGNLKK